MSGTVELCGLPGSGKSTLTAQLATRLPDGVRLVAATEGIPDDAEEVVRAHDRTLHDISLFHLDRSVEARLAVAPDLDRSKLVRQHRKLWFGRLAAMFVNRPRDGDTVLFEEGTLHELWRTSFFLDRTSPRQARRAQRELWPLLPHSDGLIHLRVSPETAVQRISGKPKLGPINRQLLEAGPASKTWLRGARRYERLIASARQRGTEVHTVRSGPQTSVDDHLAVIRDILDR